MTAGIPVATAPAPDQLQAAANDAARHLYDAETALHIARQTGVGSWISAAYDRLHEAVAGHAAAVDALKGCNRAAGISGLRPEIGLSPSVGRLARETTRRATQTARDELCAGSRSYLQNSPHKEPRDERHA